MTYLETCKVEHPIQGLLDQENARHDEVLKAIETPKFNFVFGPATGEKPVVPENPTSPQVVAPRLPIALEPNPHEPPPPSQKKSGGRSNRQTYRSRIFHLIGKGWFTAIQIEKSVGIDRSTVQRILAANKVHVQKREGSDGYMQYRLTGLAQRQFAATPTTATAANGCPA